MSEPLEDTAHDDARDDPPATIDDDALAAKDDVDDDLDSVGPRDDDAPPAREPPAPDAPVLTVDDAARLIDQGAAVDERDALLAEAVSDDAVAQAEAPAWLATALEALIFAAPEPIPASRLKDVLADEGHEIPLTVVKRALAELKERWATADKPVGGGFRLMETGAGFAFRTAPDSAPFLRRFFAAKPQRLSRAALETLAIIAYRQPVTRPQVDDIRGVDSAGALKNLLDRKLIRVLGKADDVGRPLIYGTTRAFLDFFALASLSDLPTLKDYQDLKGGEGVPEALPTPDDGPVKVMDLFDPTGSGDLVSRETEEESAKALAALESALGQATHVSARALAFEKGDVSAAEAMGTGPRFTITDEEASPSFVEDPLGEGEEHRAHAVSEEHRSLAGFPADGVDEGAAETSVEPDGSARAKSNGDARVSDEGSRFTPRHLVDAEDDAGGPARASDDEE